MTDRKRITVLLPLIWVLMLFASCGGGGGFHDLDGKFEAAKDGEDTIYRLKWDGHTLAVLNTAKADFATVLLVLRQAQQAVKFVEKESGEKVPEVVLIETIDSKSTAFKGGATLHGDKIRLVLRDSYFYPTIFAHELAHALPVSKINSGGFFSEGRANYLQSKYTELYIAGKTNSFDALLLDIYYHNINAGAEFQDKMSSLYWDSEFRIFQVQLTINDKSIPPINTVLDKFNINYSYTLFNWEVSPEEWWRLSYYVAYSYSFCHYLIEKYGFNTFEKMMQKEIALPLPKDYVYYLMMEFYHQTLMELETGFTNFIAHYEFKNHYLKDPKVREQLEGFYKMVSAAMIKHPEVSTNKTDK